MRDFRNIQVWHKSHALTLAIYKVTKSFPNDERFGLTSQLRRASVSIPSNIAEGCGRTSDADFARFLTISMGSASEVEYQLLLAHDLNLLDRSTYMQLNDQVTEAKRMLASFIKALRVSK